MKAEQKEKIYIFLQDQINQAEFRLRAYVFNDKEKRHPSRNAFLKLKMHINNFLMGKADIRWLIMCGLRGAGKTTLLAQLYEATNVDKKRKLYLSVDQITQTFGVTLKDVLDVYEELLEAPFEQIQTPVFLFLDEVQYDENWALLLKTIYDRSRKVFIISTGSSALSLQTNPDVARRAVNEKLYPMSFTEYIKIKFAKFEVKGLSKDLRTIIFNSSSAQEVYDGLKLQEKKVRSYWADIHRREFDLYMKYGTLPFMVALSNEALIYDQIKKTLERVVSIDISQISQFSSDIISKIPMVLYAVADADQLSLNSLSKDMEISRPTLEKILDTLEKTETLLRIYPHGTHINQARKPSKYLFVSPAFRAMYFNFIGSTVKEENYKGKILEDTVGLYLNRIFSNQPNTSITYDNSAGGADFILRTNNANLILEVGLGEKRFKQLAFTMSRVDAKYGMLISQSPLEVNREKNMVSIPLSYFLLT